MGTIGKIGVVTAAVQPKKSSSFLKGFLTGSAAASVLCGIAGYGYFKEDLDRRHKIKRAFEILKYGTPERPPSLMYYTNHVLSYDAGRKTPLWVAEHLTKETIDGPANRRRCKFKQDPALDPDFSSTLNDFWNSGWSRGHLVPAADNKHNQDAMDETFYLTNIIPQDVENNTGFWNRFEIFCRDLAKKYTDIRIISGPMYRPSTNSDNKKYVKYQVIGDNNIAVPTHLFKIIIAEGKDVATKYLGAFIVPNEPIKYDRELKEFQVPLEQVEKETGFKFFKNLNKGYVADLCDATGCKLMNKQEFSRYILTRKLENSRNLITLEKIWQEVEMKELKQDRFLTNLYEERRIALLAKAKVAAAY